MEINLQNKALLTAQEIIRPLQLRYEFVVLCVEPHAELEHGPSRQLAIISASCQTDWIISQLVHQ